MSGVEPHALAFDPTGAPYSAHYGDVYASRDGALGQARHVFLGGNGLPERWRGRSQFVIVETGFGLGTNFLATWQAWRDDPQRPRRLHFVSVEKHPLPAAALLARPPEALAALAAALAACWPPPLAGIHRCEFDGGRVVLSLALGDARTIVPQLAAGADAFFLDGFAPARNPQLWDAPLLRALARLARPGATLATYTTARAVRDGLAACGFECLLAAGYASKREMLVARYAPRWRMRRHDPAAPYEGERRALVVGAGLAGAACAFALARAGWQVTVCERGAAPAAGASALPTGLLHPHLSVDDNRAARLARAGFLLARARLRALDPQAAAIWSDCGVFLQGDPADPDAETAARGMLARLGAPAALAEWRDADDVAAALGARPRAAGLWFAQGAAVAPARWCAAMLAAEGIALRTACDVDQARYLDGAWQLRTRAGEALAAPVLVLANALDAARLLDGGNLMLAPVRGRVSLLAGGALAGLRGGLCGDGYLMPALHGAPAAIGATYEAATPAADEASGAAAAHAENLARLGRLLAAPTAVTVAGVFDAVRCVARDRQPLAGPCAAPDPVSADGWRGAHLEDLPRRAGAHALVALGSRGLVLASLLGELVAARIGGEPWPVERDLAAAVDPARFQLRRLRA